MITPKQFGNGQCIIIDGDIYVVLSTFHKRTAQRGAVVRTKLRNVKTGFVTEMNLDPDAAYEQAFIDKKAMRYLYNDGDAYHFMDQSNYEQFVLKKEFIGNNVDFLKEDSVVTVDFYDGNPISVELSVFVELKIAYTEPGIRGDTARGGTKPAKLETGATVKVPLFINEGDVIRVDTRTGEYVGRV